MDYPIELLPNTKHKYVECDLSSYFLLRLVDKVKMDELFEPETGEIKQSFICSPEEQINDLSSSLFGIYNLDHINLLFTDEGRKEYIQYCKPDIQLKSPEYGLHFTNDGHKLFWCAQIRLLHNVSFPYTRSNFPFTAVCIVKHTPMKWNFWHFSLRWKLGDGTLLENHEEKERKKIAKRIGHSVRVLIAKFARAQIPTGSPLPPECYMTN